MAETSWEIRMAIRTWIWRAMNGWMSASSSAFNSDAAVGHIASGVCAFPGGQPGRSSGLVRQGNQGREKAPPVQMRQVPQALRSDELCRFRVANVDGQNDKEGQAQAGPGGIVIALPGGHPGAGESGEEKRRGAVSSTRRGSQI